MNTLAEISKAQTRRHFFSRCLSGMGSVAFASLLNQNLFAAASGSGSQPSALSGTGPSGTGSHFSPRVKRVIYLHMAGGPSQLELFDNKDKLRQLNGQLCPKEFMENQRFAFIKGRPKLLGTPFSFARYGQSGLELSERLPHLAGVADELCVVKSMHTDQFNHAPAQLLLHTGSPILGRPSMGAWLSYGLGTENRNLPAFVVMFSGARGPSGGTALWGNGFLPSVHQGVRFIQLYHWGWDSHGRGHDDDLLGGFVSRCHETDQASAALIIDLKERGLLDDTLVIWGGEFGRTPMSERPVSTHLGRDHHQHAFTIWMAGGGVKRGLSYGQTDELGFSAIENPVHVHDLQATILHLLGLDHERLTYRFQGRDFRLTDVYREVRHDLLG